PVTERRDRVGELRALRTLPRLPPVVPALRLPAALQRAIDDGAEEPVVVLAFDQERDPHPALRETSAARQARLMTSATRPARRPGRRAPPRQPHSRAGRLRASPEPGGRHHAATAAAPPRTRDRAARTLGPAGTLCRAGRGRRGPARAKRRSRRCGRAVDG